MAVCAVCGNDYDKPLEITLGERRHTFDSFECTIHMLAPRCEHCRCAIIGHGHEANGTIYCCAHCAAQHGINTVADRSEQPH